MPAEISARSVATGARMRCASAAAESVWYYMVLYYMVLLRYFGICRRRVAASQVYVGALLASRRSALGRPVFALPPARRYSAKRALARRASLRGSGTRRREARVPAETARRREGQPLT